MSILALLDRDQIPSNLYDLLGRPLFDPDRPALVQAVQAANRELLACQNHPNQTRAERAMELLVELGRVSRLLEDSAGLETHDRRLVGELAREVAGANGHHPAGWAIPVLRQWLLQERRVHPESLERVIQALGQLPQGLSSADSAEGVSSDVGYLVLATDPPALAAEPLPNGPGQERGPQALPTELPPSRPGPEMPPPSNLTAEPPKPRWSPIALSDGESWLLPVDPPSPSLGRFARPWVWVGVAATVVIAIGAFLLSGGRASATVRIDVDDPQVVVYVGNEVVPREKLGTPIALPPGEYTVTVRRGTAELETRRFTLDKGSHLVLPIDLRGRALSLCRSGEECASKGHYDLAIDAYTEALLYDPRLPQALAGRGGAFARKGLFDQAMEDVTAALRLDPQCGEALRIRTDVLAEKKGPRKPRADLDPINRLDRGRAADRAARGKVRLQQGDYDGAIAEFTEALRLDPTLEKSDLPTHLADAYSKRGQRALIKGLKQPPPNQGDPDLKLRNLDQAIADFSEAIRHAPRNDAFYGYRAMAYRLRKEPEKAIADANKALEINPSNQLAKRVLTSPDLKRPPPARPGRIPEKAPKANPEKRFPNPPFGPRPMTRPPGKDFRPGNPN